MIQINDNLLAEIGLGSLPQEERRSLLNHIYETLELRVGMRLADQMTNQQLDEFEKYFEAKDDKGAFQWLETNFPNYKEIVQQEFDKLKAEVAQSAPQIVSASSQTGAAAGAAPFQAQPPANPLPLAPNDAGAQMPQPQPPYSPPPMPPQPPTDPYQPPPAPMPPQGTPPMPPAPTSPY